MNWVPLFFIDAVCHQLQFKAFEQVSQLTGSWSRFGATHCEKRRALHFVCRVEDQQVTYSIWFTRKSSRTEIPKVSLGDLSLDFDRIDSVTCDAASPQENRISLDELERDILPSVASFVANSTWGYLDPKRSLQNRMFYNAFKNCPGFNVISVQEQSQEALDFIARQVELGNVQKIFFRPQKSMTPQQQENLSETFRTFLNSHRFCSLTAWDRTHVHYELFELFLERALAGELPARAYIWAGKVTFDKSRLRALHPECRERSAVISWRIPNSNLRIVLDGVRVYCNLKVCYVAKRVNVASTNL